MSELAEAVDRDLEPIGEAPETGTPPPADNPDEPDGDLEPEPEDEPQPAQPAGMSERDLDRAIAKLVKEAERHAGRVGEIMGEDAQALLPCPLCAPNIPGFIFPATPPEDVQEAVRAVLGDVSTADYLDAPDAHLCDGCNGLGQVVTGSHVPEHRLKMCSRCNGAGYVLVPAAGTPLAAVPAAAEGTAPPPPPAAEEAPDVDPWGRRRGDQDFGRLPQYVGR